MSRLRGVFPLFLATAFGVANGIWVFGPAFKEQQQEKDEQAKKALEISQPSESEQVEKEALKIAEAAASRPAATESTLKSPSSNSWWSNMNLWSKDSDTTSGRQADNPADRKTKD